MKCSKCGKEVIKKNIQGHRVVLNKRTVFVTPESFGELETFISVNNKYITGRVNDDGIKCHRIHRC